MSKYATGVPHCNVDELNDVRSLLMWTFTALKCLVYNYGKITNVLDKKICLNTQ